MTNELQWFLSDQLDAKRRIDRDPLARQKLTKSERGAIEAALFCLSYLAHNPYVKFGDELMVIEWTGEGDNADFTRIYRMGDREKHDLWDTDDPVFDRAANDAFIQLAAGEDVSEVDCQYEGRWTKDGDWEYGNMGDYDD